jgi:hypothetical protein
VCFCNQGAVEGRFYGKGRVPEAGGAWRSTPSELPEAKVETGRPGSPQQQEVAHPVAKFAQPWPQPMTRKNLPESHSGQWHGVAGQDQEAKLTSQRIQNPALQCLGEAATMKRAESRQHQDWPRPCTVYDHHQALACRQLSSARQARQWLVWARSSACQRPLMRTGS